MAWIGHVAAGLFGVEERSLSSSRDPGEPLIRYVPLIAEATNSLFKVVYETEPHFRGIDFVAPSCPPPAIKETENRLSQRMSTRFGQSEAVQLPQMPSTLIFQNRHET